MVSEMLIKVHSNKRCIQTPPCLSRKPSKIHPSPPPKKKPDRTWIASLRSPPLSTTSTVGSRSPWNSRRLACSRSRLSCVATRLTSPAGRDSCPRMDRGALCGAVGTTTAPSRVSWPSTPTFMTTGSTARRSGPRRTRRPCSSTPRSRLARPASGARRGSIWRRCAAVACGPRPAEPPTAAATSLRMAESSRSASALSPAASRLGLPRTSASNALRTAVGCAGSRPAARPAPAPCSPTPGSTDTVPWLSCRLPPRRGRVSEPSARSAASKRAEAAPRTRSSRSETSTRIAGSSDEAASSSLASGVVPAARSWSGDSGSTPLTLAVR